MENVQTLRVLSQTFDLRYSSLGKQRAERHTHRRLEDGKGGRSHKHRCKLPLERKGYYAGNLREGGEPVRLKRRDSLFIASLDLHVSQVVFFLHFVYVCVFQSTM